MQSARLGRIKAGRLEKETCASTASIGCATGCSEDRLVKVSLRVLRGE